MRDNNFSTPYVVAFITAYNEEESIEEVIQAINQKNQEGLFRDFYLDVVVVDDGSRDKTEEKARKAGVKKIVSHPVNRGLGAATRTGMQTAYEMGADIAVKVDADAQFDPENIEKVIRPILGERADCVFGSRFSEGVKYDYKAPVHRTAGNKFFAWLTSKITGLKITDSSTGLIAFNKRYLSRFQILRDYNETQQLFIDAWGKKMRVIEVSVSSKPRKAGKSFISWKYPFKVIPAMIFTFIHVHPLKSFVWAGIVVILLGVLVGVLWYLGLSKFFGDITATILMLMGFQIILFGFLADVISKKR